MSLLLCLSVCIDYADTVTINNTDDGSVVAVNSTDDVLLAEGDDLIAPNPKKDKVYKEKDVVEKTKKKIPLITITAKPSVKSRYSYKWYTTTFVNYCPHCHRYRTLANVHKYPARFEQELTCSESLGGCGADYCGVTGKEKYSWSYYYLTKA